ncbi:hypothetical protein [Clostridium sp.]
MKGLRIELEKFYSFFYFTFWGFIFSAGYFEYKKSEYNSFLMSI